MLFGTFGDLPAALLGLFASLVAGEMARRAAKRSRKWTEGQATAIVPTLADRIEILRSNLKQSTSIMDEIHAELNLQTTALDRVRAEAEQNQRLAALHQEEADAVRKLVAATIEGAQGKAARPAKRQQWLFFLAGLFFSVPLGVGVNFLYDILFK
jgi:hypothetical protein